MSKTRHVTAALVQSDWRGGVSGRDIQGWLSITAVCTKGGKKYTQRNRMREDILPLTLTFDEQIGEKKKIITARHALFKTHHQNLLVPMFFCFALVFVNPQYFGCLSTQLAA